MNSNDQSLTKQEIVNLLRQLSDRLKTKGVQGELSLVGGAVMVLAFGSRESTRDIDGIFAPKEAVSISIKELAEDLQLDDGWLNESVKGYLSPAADFTQADMPKFENLVVKRATDEYMFAMKACSARMSSVAGEKSNDLADLEFLVKRLAVKTFEEASKIIERFPVGRSLNPNVRYFVQEAIDNVYGGGP